MTGKTVLVTGGAGGIGLETVKALSRMGADVVIGARDTERSRAAVDGLVRGGARAELLPIDMASLAAIRGAAQRFAAAHPRLDVLVNNAGIVTKRREVNADGHEVIWATNFLGPFLLTRLLLPFLQNAPGPRVVNVSSAAHSHGRLDWDDLELTRGYRRFKAYANSKLALILFTRELSRREPGVAANALHPGVIATGIWRAAPRPFRWILGKALPSAARGAAPVVRLAAAPELDGVTGRYFDRFREVPPVPAARNDADAAKLWLIAEQATGLPGPPV